MFQARRHFLQGLTAALGLSASSFRFAAIAAERRHGTSLFGGLKYPPDFTHFDYVNPQAPKGGHVRLAGIGGFDSLNPFSAQGQPAGMLSLTFDSLMESSLDEPGSAYGLIAQATEHARDFSTATFHLRPEARFHDGAPVTARDVAWSMMALKKAHPAFGSYYRDVVNAKVHGTHEVTFVFARAGNRELPHIVAELTVLPKHWWTGRGAEGEQRAVEKATLEPPLGSGPYAISHVAAGKSLTFRRVEDYWARHLPLNAGRHNFDRLSAVYFRDRAIAREAFKAGRLDYWEENTAKAWATGFDFPAVSRGHVVREEVTLENPQGMQAFVLNLRRAKFADRRTRRALNLAFDFEWANANLFHGQYRRTTSFFANSELAATGLPGEGELALLRPLADQLPKEVFTAPYVNPVNHSSQGRRRNLRQAARLLRQAGWRPGPDKRLVNAEEEPFTLEILLASPQFERIVLPYISRLKLIGVTASARVVDAAQYIRRRRQFDFDIIVDGWAQSLSPGNEQRDFWSSQAAGIPGSRNYAGISDPAVDRLIEAVVFARDRPRLITAARALDRVLLWNHFVIPMWHIAHERIAYWNRFGRPDKLPRHSVGFPSIWWWDERRAAALDAQLKG